MLKNALLLLTCLMTLGVAAQKASLQNLSFGAEIGPNLSGAFLAKSPSTKVKGSPDIGIEVGVFAELPLSTDFSFRPRLQFSNEGYTAKLYGDKYPIRMSFVKLPLDVIYHSHLGGNKWFFGAGPYVAMGLGGHYNGQGLDKQTIHFGSDPDNDQAKRGDVGIDLLAGYKLMDNIVLSADLNAGFVNILNEAYWGAGCSSRTINFGITGAYVFGGK